MVKDIKRIRASCRDAVLLVIEKPELLSEDEVWKSLRNLYFPTGQYAVDSFKWQDELIELIHTVNFRRRDDVLHAVYQHRVSDWVQRWSSRDTDELRLYLYGRKGLVDESHKADEHSHQSLEEFKAHMGILDKLGDWG